MYAFVRRPCTVDFGWVSSAQQRKSVVPPHCPIGLAGKLAFPLLLVFALQKGDAPDERVKLPLGQVLTHGTQSPCDLARERAELLCFPVVQGSQASCPE